MTFDIGKLFSNSQSAESPSRPHLSRRSQKPRSDYAFIRKHKSDDDKDRIYNLPRDSRGAIKISNPWAPTFKPGENEEPHSKSSERLTRTTKPTNIKQLEESKGSFLAYNVSFPLISNGPNLKTYTQMCGRTSCAKHISLFKWYIHATKHMEEIQKQGRSMTISKAKSFHTPQECDEYVRGKQGKAECCLGCGPGACYSTQSLREEVVAAILAAHLFGRNEERADVPRNFTEGFKDVEDFINTVRQIREQVVKERDSRQNSREDQCRRKKEAGAREQGYGPTM
jgi:hypothetical protein